MQFLIESKTLTGSLSWVNKKFKLIKFCSGSPPQLTTLGRTMSLFPLDPRYTKVILASVEHQCLEEALTVIAVLSGETIFVDPPSKRQQAHDARQRLCYLSITLCKIVRLC